MRGRVDGQAALPHQRTGLLVQPPGGHHRPVPGQQLLDRGQHGGAGTRRPLSSSTRTSAPLPVGRVTAVVISTSAREDN